VNQADTILYNATILTMNDAYTVYDPGAVVISAGKIITVGDSNSILQSYPSIDKFDCGGKLLMPGLINAHTHVPMTLLRGLADDLRLDVWLMGYMMPVEREFVSPEFVQLGTQLACAEMIRSGVTCFADMYYFEETIAETIYQIGMRAVCSQTVLKFPSPDALSYEESLISAERFIQRWKGNPLITPSVAPHAPYTCTPDILRATARLAAQYEVPLLTHLSETALEVENMRRTEGMPVIPYVKKQGLFESRVVAAHCVHVDEGEMRTLLHAGAGVIHNPTSNMKLASGFAPISRMIELGLSVGLGTDGPASNNDLDMFEEMRLAALIAKGITNDPTVLPAKQVLKMATKMGADAIGIGNITGSLETGKCADLILLDLKGLHYYPVYRREQNAPYAQIIYSAKANDVTHLMVNGKWLMIDHQLTTIDETKLIEQSDHFARKIEQFLVKREQSVLSKLIAIGGASEEESFEIQSKFIIHDISPILKLMHQPDIRILRERHYREYDTYFTFDDPEQGRLRYREDHFINDKGDIYNTRNRLTLIGTARERSFLKGSLLSRSRYLAPATQGLRFYREYFKPVNEYEVIKDRLRYLVQFKETEFFINLDHVTTPSLGYFLEIKSRTWSRKDAKDKSALLIDLVHFFGLSESSSISKDYIDMINSAQINSAHSE